MNHIYRSAAAFAALFITALAAYAQINVDQVIRLGRNALYFEDYVLSIQYFNQAIEARPTLAQPYFYRALAKYSLDDMKGAIDDASRAIDRNPFITDAYELRGVARQSSDNPREAIDDYRQVLKMMPVNKGVIFNLAMAQQEADMPDSAEVTLRHLMELAPRYERTYIGYARLLLQRGDTAEARTHIDRALELNRFNINALLLRADLAIRQGKEHFPDALADMDEVIRLNPRQSSFFVNRAFLRHELDDYFGAMSDFDYALQLDPDNTAAYFNRALLRAEVMDLDRAVADLDRVIALTGQRDYRALYNRAMINKDRGRLKEALADAEVIVNAFPDMAAAYFLRFDIRQAMKDRHAREDYDHSLLLARKMKEKEQEKEKELVATGAKPAPAGETTPGATPAQAQTPEELFMDFDPDNPEAVAGRFAALITIDTSAGSAGASAGDIADPFGGKAQRNGSIRGRVQDRDDIVELEPMFIATYYSSPTELKPSGDYMKEAEEVNATRLLRFLLQVTNHEAPLSDSDDIRRHFESIDYYTAYLSTHTPRAIDFFGRGMDFMTVRDYSRAIADFTQATQLAPDFTLAFFMRAAARIRAAEAAESTDEQQPPAAIETRPAISRAAMQQAIADLDTVIALSPTLAIAHYNKGVILATAGDYTSALNAFNRAIELRPDMGEAFYNRGYVYFHLGDAHAGARDLSHAGQLGIVPAYSLLRRMRQ